MGRPRQESFDWSAVCNQPRPEIKRIFKYLAKENLSSSCLESAIGRNKPLLTVLGEGVKA